MEFGLAKMTLGSRAFVPIGQADYDAIRLAREGLLEALGLEEKFNLVVDNYLDLEIGLLDSAAHHMVLLDADYRSFQLERALFNRRVMNLLTAGRAYVDHSPQHMKRLLGPDDYDSQHLAAALSEQYDARLGFRTATALRNYVQHHAFPIHSLLRDARRVERDDGPRLVHRTVLYLQPGELRTDGDFKKSVLLELESVGEKVDLMQLLRDYLEGLWVVHETLRKTISPLLESWESTLRDALARFETEASEDSRHIAAYIRGERGRLSGRLPVFLDGVDYRRYLERKNSSLANLPIRVATNEGLSDGT